MEKPPKKNKTHRAIVIWDIAQQRGVPGLSAVKLSIFTVWKSGCTVSSPLPSLSESLYRLQRPASSLGSRGQQQIQLVSTRHRGREEPGDWELAREREAWGWGCTHKGQVKLAAALPMGHHLAPQRLDRALGCTGGDVRIQEMSPTPIQLHTESILTQQQLHRMPLLESHFSRGGKYDVFLWRPA